MSRKWYFLHEHPASAVSWRPPLIKAVRVLEGGRGRPRRLARQSAHRVECIVGDQCVYGQEVPGRGWAGIWGGGLTNPVIRQATSSTAGMRWGGSAPAVTDTFGYLADTLKEPNATHLLSLLRYSAL